MAKTETKTAAKPKAEKAPKTPNLCQCGCGGETMRRYMPGHDAKHKGQLIAAALEGDSKAEEKLAELGWSKFLDASRAKAQRKAEAKAAAEARRAERKEAAAKKAAAKKAAPKAKKASSKRSSRPKSKQTSS